MRMVLDHTSPKIKSDFIEYVIGRIKSDFILGLLLAAWASTAACGSKGIHYADCSMDSRAWKDSTNLFISK